MALEVVRNVAWVSEQGTTTEAVLVKACVLFWLGRNLVQASFTLHQRGAGESGEVTFTDLHTGRVLLGPYTDNGVYGPILFGDNYISAGQRALFIEDVCLPLLIMARDGK